MQVMSNHSESNISDAVKILKTAKTEAERELEAIGQPDRSARRFVA
jgi:hypothetical protein